MSSLAEGGGPRVSVVACLAVALYNILSIYALAERRREGSRTRSDVTNGI